MNPLKLPPPGIAALALLGSMATAHAADLGAAPAEPAAPIPYAFNWTGFYIGDNVGYGFGGHDRVGLDVPYEGRKANDVGTLEDSGVFGGVQAGFNYQLGSFVFGFEADIQGSGISDMIRSHLILLNERDTVIGRSRVDWFGTVRPRIGFAWDRVRLYGTGGLAFGGIDYRVSADSVFGRTDLKSDDTQVGWTAGAGIEYAFMDNWSAKLEYKYVNFGKNYVAGRQNGLIVTTDETPDFQSVSVGLNYRFGGMPMAHPAEAGEPPDAFSWTGLYAGANLGYGFGGQDQVGLQVPNTGVPNIDDAGKFEDSGAFGGLQAGYNYQMGSFVVGVEGDMQGSGVSDRIHRDIRFLGQASTETGKSNIDWFGTLRPRAGFAWDRLLVYGTGGLAVGGVDYLVSAAGPFGRFDLRNDDTRVGWTAGAGIEYAFMDNWSAKLEYKYVNFGKEHLEGNIQGLYHDLPVTTDETPDFSSVDLGVNYRF